VTEEELEAVSAFPITNDLAPGVNEVTEGVVDPPDKLPVEDDGLAVEAPLISYMETEPVTVDVKEALMVSAPELPAFAYQM